MEKFMNVAEKLLATLLPTVTGWLVLIFVLVLLLFLFKCFSSPFNSAFPRIRKVRRMAFRASKRNKCLLSGLEKKRIRKHLAGAGRLVDATLYDDPSLTEIKKAGEMIAKMELLARTFDSAQSNGNEKNMRLVMRSMVRNADAFLALPKMGRRGMRS